MGPGERLGQATIRHDRTYISCAAAVAESSVGSDEREHGDGPRDGPKKLGVRIKSVMFASATPGCRTTTLDANDWRKLAKESFDELSARVEDGHNLSSGQDASVELSVTFDAAVDGPSSRACAPSSPEKSIVKAG